MSAIVVIPLYKARPYLFEEIALRQCARVLAPNRSMCFVAPKGLDLAAYDTIFVEEAAKQPEKKYFPPHFFESLSGYNRLMLSPLFYESFNEYDYILIYQTDAYVFEDKLDYFCSLGYDYIGAPWFVRLFGKNCGTRFSGAGNGGFSLRKVSACLEVLNYKGRFWPKSQLFSTNNSPVIKWKKLAPEKRKELKWSKTVDFFTEINSSTEDYFWALDVPAAGLPFKVAPPQKAMYFSFEQKPSLLFYHIFEGCYPFGCHAWQRYEFEECWRHRILGIRTTTTIINDVEMPVITIITVCYQAKETIERTIVSVLEQSYPAIEYIIVDGNSTDGTREIISRYADKIACVISEPDNGLYDAMNKAIVKATGYYLWFLNAGDTIYTKDTVREMVNGCLTCTNAPDIIYGETALTDSKGNFLRMRRLKAPTLLTWKSFRQGMLVSHQSFIVKPSIAPLYDLRYRYSSDFDWAIRCMKKAKNIHNSNLTLSNYLEEGLTTQNRNASLKERFRIMARYYGWLPTIVRHIGFAIRFGKAKRKNQL